MLNVYINIYCINFEKNCNILFLLHHQVALHMRAYRTFKDVKEVTRKNGEEWLIKMADTEAHIPDVYEEVWACTYS